MNQMYLGLILVWVGKQAKIAYLGQDSKYQSK